MSYLDTLRKRKIVGDGTKKVKRGKGLDSRLLFKRCQQKVRVSDAAFVTEDAECYLKRQIFFCTYARRLLWRKVRQGLSLTHGSKLQDSIV